MYLSVNAFDNGVSLCYSSFNAQQLDDINPLQDIVANNFLGTRSLQENLQKFVPGTIHIARLQAAHKAKVLDGLPPALEGTVQGKSGEEFASFLWRMIWERWCWLEWLLRVYTPMVFLW